MDIQYAILGLLSWQPFSGYDLKKIIAESDLFYWSGNNNQIYNNLVEMHKNGWVTQEVQLQESLPAKKIYTITAQGRAVLHQWAMADPPPLELHNNFLIQLAWAHSLSDEAVDALLAKYEEEISVRLRMRRAQAEAPGPNRNERERYLWQKISDNMLAVYQHELDWIREVRRGLPKTG